MFDDSRAPGAADTEPVSPPTSDEPEDPEMPEPDPVDPVVERFRACRWHDKVEGGAEYCSHGEVLPYAGKNGFSAAAWCPECAFFKVRRKTRRRDPDHDDY